jgi:DNA-binding ferritin-like protein (Dps family)
MGPLELDVAHEQAIQYLEGQDQRFEAEEHRKVRSPSLKRKLVLRAINKRRNKALTHSRVGGGRFATTSKQGVATESLTSVAYPADESKSAEMKRLTRAKAVFKQLAQMSRQALKRLKAIEVERDANGDLTNKGREQLLAKQYVEQTVQLAAAMIETGQTDLGSIQLGESIANMLGKIQTAGDLKLANLMGKQEKLMDEFVERRGGTEGRTAPKEPKKTRVQRVAEQNQKLAAFLKHRLRMDTLWPAEFGYRNIVRPILTKFSESYFSTKGYYKPSLEEAWELQWVADQWKNDPTKPDEQYYTPLRRALTQLGFSWDTNGKLVVKHTDGEFEYDPTESMLTNRAGLDSPMSLKRSDFETTPERGQSAEEFNKQREEAANRQAIDAIAKDSAATRQEATRHVRATTIMAAFRKVVDNSKSTINKLIDAERKMLADLSAEGFLPRNATTFAVIRVPGRADITYRRVASDLANRRITKAQARGRMRAITKKHVQEMATYRDKASATARDLTGTQTGDTSFEYVYDSQARADEIDMFGKGIEAAAGTVADLLNNRDGIVQHRVLLDAVIANLPESSFYGALARKLRAELLPAVEVSYDWGLGGRKLIKNRTTTGRYYARDNSVVISRDNIGRMKNRPTALLHTLTHELVHAQTVASIHSNARLYQYVDELRRQAAEAVGGAEDLWYGLKNPEEFVAEAFSNPEFQTLLKSTPVDNETLWTKFTTFVKKILGFTDAPQFDNIFDALMAAEPQLIEQAGIKFDGGVYDNVLGAVAGKINDRMNLTHSIEQRTRNSASKFWRGKVSHAISTMRQMRERYEKYFTDGSLKRYMSSFFARNAKNNELLQLPEKLSRKWTQLRDQNPDAEIDFSQIATESTLYSIDPSQSATHERNKKTAAAQKERYNDLRKRWKALPTGYKKLWAEVTAYYDSSMKSETKLLLLNAIRGVVTKGSGVTMDVDVFSKKYNEQNISKFDTVEKIKDEFGEYLGSSESEIDNVVGLINRLATVPQMGQGVYFPLMRYGDYVVFASKDLPSEFFADSQAANARAAELRAEDPTLTVGVHKKGVGDVDLKSPEFEKKATIDSNAALASIISTLEGNAAAQQAIKQFYLRSLGDASFRKRELKRQNRAGVDYDLQHRNFANYAKQSAYYRSQLEYGWQMAKGMSDMNTFLRSRRAEQQPPALSGMSTEQLRNVYQTLQERDAMMTDPVQVNKVVRGGIALTQFYMLTSASYHIINSSQPWMVTLPTMGGRFGWGQAFTAMKEAQALIKDPIFGQVKESGGGFKMLPWLKNADTTAENAFGVFDQLTEKMKKDGGYDDVLEMLQSLRKTQVLEVSPLTELREMASGKTSNAAKALDASRVMAHLVEVNNRVLTAVAAYRLELNRQLAEGVGPDTAKELATQYAERMVSQTQFDYSTANKPPVFMKYPLMFQFMQWSQHIYAHLVRNMAGTLRGDKEARSALLGVLGTHAMVGGIIGVALQPIKMAFGLAMMAFGDEDEPYTFKNAMSGATFDRSITAFTDDMFGTTVSTALTRGLPAALGADVSTRMSLGTLYFIDLRGDTPESVLGSLGSSFGGAFVNQMLTFGRGAQYIGSGDFAKAVESFSPKFLRDIVRAGRFATDGLVNNAGDQVLDTGDLGFVDVALQAVGFTPTTTSQFYQGQAAIKDVEGYVRQRKTRLLKEFRTAMPNDRAGIIRQVVEFNRAYPQEAITRSSLLRNLKSKYEREAQYSRYGAAIDDRKAQLYQGYGEPYR